MKKKFSSARGTIDPGISRVSAALAAVGSPQEDLAGRVLHVAGTNGKGSVCAMAFAALRQAGLCVGAFNSPHLIEPLDAIRLARGGKDLGVEREEWARLQDEVMQSFVAVSSTVDDPSQLTTFELQFVTTMLLFARTQVDVAVVEVGLGGREDATNVMVRPAACAITGIALDHQTWLGPTLVDIARHKAGIFREACPALIATARLNQELVEVLTTCAREAGSHPITLVPPSTVLAPQGIMSNMRSSSASPDCQPRLTQQVRVPNFRLELEVPLLGDVQRSNASLAVAMLLALRLQGLMTRSLNFNMILDEDMLSDRVIAEGIRATHWPGRLEWLVKPGLFQGRPVLLDGAHNPDSAERLASFVEHEIRSAGRRVAWIVAMSAGKDTQGILSQLLTQDSDVFIAVTFGPVEGMPWVLPTPPEELREAASALRPALRRIETHSDVFTALEHLGLTEPDVQPVVCGSLYLVAKCLGGDHAM